MEQQSIRRIMRLDPIDEKMEFLASKGIFFIGEEVDIATFFNLFTGMLPRMYAGDMKKVWIIMDSPGGNITQGFAVYDFLKAVTEQGVEVNILCVGVVASMAVCIMQAATKRYSFPNTQFTVHQASISSSQGMEANEFREASKELDRINEIVLKIISGRSGMGLEKLKDLSNKIDYSIDASSAKEFGSHGLVDEVVTTFPFKIFQTLETMERGEI